MNSKREQAAREWLINGGGGHEDGEDGIRALTVTGEGLVYFLEEAIEDRQTIEEIGSLCFKAGLNTPDGSVLPMVKQLLSEREFERQRGFNEAKELVAQWLDKEDIEGDPDDLYTGRKYRAAAIRALERKP